MGCISYLLFDPVVRYGTGCANTGYEAENQGEPVPNAPYACLTRWCVTGRAVPTLATRRKIRASPSLTHPTALR
ncbi:MAG: hypothetical protein F6K26_45740 [Moorea sp. SIO2I5]|nr:hypothetical protein [Moorena sp. SIO2I5]